MLNTIRSAQLHNSPSALYAWCMCVCTVCGCSRCRVTGCAFYEMWMHCIEAVIGFLRSLPHWVSCSAARVSRFAVCAFSIVVLVHWHFGIVAAATAAAFYRIQLRRTAIQFSCRSFFVSFFFSFSTVVAFLMSNFSLRCLNLDIQHCVYPFITLVFATFGHRQYGGDDMRYTILFRDKKK